MQGGVADTVGGSFFDSERGKAMKRVLMIGTGGTIASEMTDNGLTPKLDTEQLLRYIPAVRELCHVECLQLMNLDSTDMTPAEWLKMAKTIQENYGRYDGFVISHGTDTMAYTAAALSYLIQDADKPIVLTGAQKPIDSDVTDSKTNLLDAFRIAADSAFCGVTIVFNGSVILGTRARKVRSKSFSAFASINYPELARVVDGAVFRYIMPQHADKPRFYDKLDAKVGLVKLIPGMDAGVLDYVLSRDDAVVIESFGVGGVPSLLSTRFYDCIAGWLKLGKVIVITTQVQNEGSNLTVYRVGHGLKAELSVLEAYDMTTEAVVAKLMWILGQSSDPAFIRRSFYTTVANDILYECGSPESC